MDDTPYGGGAGMVLKIEPIFNCLRSLSSKFKIPAFAKTPTVASALADKSAGKQNLKTRIILFSAKGKKYTQADARRLAKYENLILICGRYEGVDERVAKYLADEEISIGDYILTGGEIPAMAVVDSVSRLVSGVLGNIESAKHESFSQKDFIEHPQYTKPAEFRGWKVPEVLLAGNHAEIEKWRRRNAKSVIGNKSHRQ